MPETDPTVHATAILVGPKAVLIRGPSGSGKSRLALGLLQSWPFARLVGDDRVYLEAANGRLLVRPADELAGLLEVRGLGIRRLPFELVAVLGLIVDLGVETDRLPEPSAMKAELSGVILPRVSLPAEPDPLPVVLATLGRPISGN
jgi:serine kinase of HPr protein (carbohydrate metabolism regulator)